MGQEGDKVRGRGRLILAGSLVFAMAVTIATAAQAPKINEYKLGAVTVVIPPAQGWEDASAMPGMRDRFPSSDRLETLAIHLPASVLTNYDPDQDLTFYALVGVGTMVKAENSPLSLIAEVAQRFASGEVPDKQKELQELAARTGVSVTGPINMGVFDRTPASFSGLLAARVTIGARGMNLLTSTTFVLLKKRLVNVYVYRKFETDADRTALQDFTKAWIRRIIAANP